MRVGKMRSKSWDGTFLLAKKQIEEKFLEKQIRRNPVMWKIVWQFAGRIPLVLIFFLFPSKVLVKFAQKDKI